MKFFSELKRRNVFRMGIAYALGAWVLLQIVDFVLEVITAPDWILQVFFLAAAVGLPVVLIFSWVYEVTPEGIVRESEVDRAASITPQTGRKLDRVIIAFLAIAVVLLLADRFWNRPAESPGTGERAAVEETPEPPPAPAVRAAHARSVAVLPFAILSNGPDDEYFADGLTEEILNALAQLPDLLVTARTSAFHFKGQDVPVQEIAATLGVAHIVEGSVRRAGDRLRVTAQLIRAADGFHLWSENYDSASADTIAVQEDIAEKIALALDLVLDEGMRQSMRQAGLRDPEAFIALQKGREWYNKAHGAPDLIAPLREANRYFDIVIDRVPGYAPAYQLHSDLYFHILINDSTDTALPDVTDQEIAEAPDRARADFAAAVQHASPGDERDNMELDLAFLTGNWRGMPARIERILAEQGCTEANWLENLTLPFGYAEPMQARLREFIACDPLQTIRRASLARAKLWSGDAEGALAVALEGSEIAPGSWLSQSLVMALAALGRFEEAEAEIAARMQTDLDVSITSMLVAAARGDSKRTARIFEEYLENPDAAGFWHMLFHAWSGDRESANRMAAEIDRHPFGRMSLTIITQWCMCGSPWEMEFTPNYAALLESAGLPWPPPSPIAFPLKDW